MKLQEWIDNKCKELVENKTFKEVKFRRVNRCEISAYMTREFFDFSKASENISMDMEIEEITNRKSLSESEEIEAFEVTFDVIKPRCRKTERYALFVRPV